MDERLLSKKIKQKAQQLGFSACGIAQAQAVAQEEQDYLRAWLSADKQASMHYMQEHFEKRCDPRLLVKGTKSIVVLALNYFPQQQLQPDQLQFAYYAYGKDYHEVMKKKLNELFDYINQELSPASGRAFCDSAPVLERYWAIQAGIGWRGKNSQLIIPQAGSYFFLGELFIDIQLQYDAPISSRCGKCAKCLQNCPTKALEGHGQLNAQHCLSYLTIEHKGAIPLAYAGKQGKTIYGCDQCQTVCPWNRFAKPCSEPELTPSKAFLAMQLRDWKELSISTYCSLFKGSAVKRTKYEGLTRNISYVLP